MPPAWKWPLPWELDRHINKVIEERHAKYGSKDRTKTEAPEPAPGTRNQLYDEAYEALTKG